MYSNVSHPSGLAQNHLARDTVYSETREKTRWTKEEVERQHHGMDRPGVRQVSEGKSQRAVENSENRQTDCKVICGALLTLVIKGLMMMMM